MKNDYKELGAKENFLLRLQGDLQDVDVDPQQAESLQNEIGQQKEELRGIKDTNTEKVEQLNSLADDMATTVETIKSEKRVLEERLVETDMATAAICSMEADVAKISTDEQKEQALQVCS